MIGVSVPALQKWRKGKIASGANRNRLAGLVAAGTLIQRNYMVEEIASWFEKPLVAGCPVTPIDMYARGDCVLVFGHAGGHLGPEQILDSYEPEWRDKYNSPYVAYRSADGQMSIGIELD